MYICKKHFFNIVIGVKGAFCVIGYKGVNVMQDSCGCLKQQKVVTYYSVRLSFHVPTVDKPTSSTRFTLITLTA